MRINQAPNLENAADFYDWSIHSDSFLLPAKTICIKVAASDKEIVSACGSRLSISLGKRIKNRTRRELGVIFECCVTPQASAQDSRSNLNDKSVATKAKGSQFKRS